MRKYAYTSLSMYQTCPRKYYYRYVRALAPTRKAIALDIGSLFHEGVAKWLRPIIDMQPDEARDCQRGRIERGEHLTLVEPLALGCASNDRDEKVNAMATALILGYIDHYQAEPHVITAVEYEWTLPVIVPSYRGCRWKIIPDVCLGGKVDALAVGPDGTWFLIEHKAVSDVDAGYISHLPIDLQIHLYTHAMGRLVGVPVNTVLYDVVIKSAIRGKAAETPEEFRARLLAEYTGEGVVKKGKNGEAKGGVDSMFYRQELLLDSRNTQTLLGDVLETVQEVVAAEAAEREGRGRWCHVTGACLGKWGACEYLPVCSAGDDVTAVGVVTYTERAGNKELAPEGAPKVNEIDNLDVPF